MKIIDKSSNILLYPIIVTSLLLLIPLITMQFSDDVLWTFTDFIFAGGLILGTGCSFILFAQKESDLIFRVATGLALFSTLFMIWANLAVGLIGNESDPINLLYFVILAIGIAGTFIAKFKPVVMARVLFIMATGIIAITIYALISEWREVAGSSLLEVIGVNALFVVLFMISAGLFQYSDMTKESSHL